KIRASGSATSHVATNEEALLKCQSALDLKDRGDYEGARKVMNPLWTGIGKRPEVSGLHQSVAAEVLLCVGILTRWIGSRNQVRESQEDARDLISESITFYESVGDLRKVAAG